MKKLTLTLLLFTTALIHAQDERSSILTRKHEVKVGAVKLLAGPIFEGTYEYIHARDLTFGVAVLANLNTQNDYYEDFSITPFARFYFQEHKDFGGKGFFVEGFGKYSTGHNVFRDYEEAPKYSAAAVGLSLGYKWINRTGFVIEILTGFGRTLGNSDAAPDALFRGDLNLGYRF